GFFRRFGTPTLGFAIIFIPVFVWICSKKINGRQIAITLPALFLLSLLFISNDAVKGIILYSSEIEDVSRTMTLSENEEDRENIVIEEGDRRSTFLLVYDSLADLKTFEALGVDISPLEKILKKYNFKIYQNTYSLGHFSIQSMSQTFDFAVHKDEDGPLNTMRIFSKKLTDLIAGKGRAFRIFSQNGYKTCDIQHGSMTKGASFTDVSFPHPAKKYTKVLDPLAALIKGIFFGEFRFDAAGFRIYTDDDMRDFLHSQVPLQEGPWFTAIHVNFPSHAQISGKLLPNETELFIERYNASLPKIEEDINVILSKDPSAIIIIMGDHGPHLTGDGLMLADYPPEEITELMIRDRFGALVAIRWPDGERASKYDANLLINQDVFPVIFAYLTDSPYPLSLMIQDKKVVFKERVFIDNGVFIEQHAE
ncbi:MAG: LTA synthase family protein, partial [Synergistaceae bacterium]|nr:LTA synthase family protein [Synergistaceae bacterium]